MNDFDIGFVSPKNLGLVKEKFKDRETISIVFPADLHTKIKAMILACCLFFVSPYKSFQLFQTQSTLFVGLLFLPQGGNLGSRKENPRD